MTLDATTGLPDNLAGSRDTEILELRRALALGLRMCNEALPKFNWGASALDANAIWLLNEAPGIMHAALFGRKA